jgi:KAP family P-loop domain
VPPIHRVDPKNLASTGWAVIFAPDHQSEVREALRPLLDLRSKQAGPYYREYTYLRGQTSLDFLNGQGADAGPADPKLVPYYLLLVGSPEAIPFDFQTELDIQYAVGRIFFERIEDYECYARSVTQAEQGSTTLPPKQVILFSASNRDDLSTHRLARDIVEPLAGNLRTDYPDWPVQTLIGEQATKAKLGQLLGGDEMPALLLAAGHGLAFPADNPHQHAAQGAIVCQDWPGPENWKGPLSPAHYFTADDIQENSRLFGLIALLLSDYGIGTPEMSQPDADSLIGAPERLAFRPFLSSLPQRLLSHPGGGALGVVGGLGRLWLGHLPLYIFDSFAGRLMDGYPLGSAMEIFDQRRAELAIVRSHFHSSNPAQRGQLKSFHPGTNTAFLVAGDPAVRLVFNDNKTIFQKPPVPENRSTEGVVASPAPKSPASESPTITDLKLRQEGSTSAPRIGTIPGATRDWVSPKDNDQLGFHAYLSALADLIESEDTQPPLTIGIFGSWGMGKSFILKHLPQRIAKNADIRRQRAKIGNIDNTPQPPKIAPVEFNAWEYSANETIWPALARKIVDELDDAVRWKRFERLRLKLRRNLKPQISKNRGWLTLGGIALILITIILLIDSDMDSTKLWTAVLTLGGVGLWKILTDTLNNSLGQWIADLFQDRSYGKPLDIFQRIRDDLVILDKKLREAGGRALVLVDDLDRCEPSKIVEMLQAVKLLLDFETFVVCLAIDSRIVTRALEKHYEGLLGEAGVSGYDYLDKIVQIPFRIPTPLPRDVELFIGNLMHDPPQPDLTSARIFDSGTHIEKPVYDEAADHSRSTALPVGNGAAEEDLPGTESTDTVSPLTIGGSSFTYDEFLAFSRIKDLLRPNPRHLKRLVNVYRLVRSLAIYESKFEILKNPAATVAWISICAQWPYTAHLMTLELQRIMQAEEAGGAALPSEAVLVHLFSAVRRRSDFQRRRTFDDDPALLEALIKRSARVGWDDLEVIRRYTINFNPAIELEWTTDSNALE